MPEIKCQGDGEFVAETVLEIVAVRAVVFLEEAGVKCGTASRSVFAFFPVPVSPPNQKVDIVEIENAVL